MKWFSDCYEIGKKTAERKIFFIVDANSDIGMGHLVRSMELAREFASRNTRILLHIEHSEGDLWIRDWVVSKGYQYNNDSYENISEKDDFLVLDKKMCEPKLLEETCSIQNRLIISDEPFFAKVRLFVWPELRGNEQELMRCGYSKEQCAAGKEYILLREEVRLIHRDESKRPVVFVCLGGGEPPNAVLQLIETLDAKAELFDMYLAFGHEYPIVTEIKKRFISANHHIEVLVRSPHYLTRFASATVAVYGGGTMAYEAMYWGIPGVHVVTVPGQQAEAAWVNTMGVGTVAQIHETERIADAVITLLRNESLRRSQSAQMRAYVDGLGAQRIVDKAFSLVSI